MRVDEGKKRRAINRGWLSLRQSRRNQHLISLQKTVDRIRAEREEAWPLLEPTEPLTEHQRLILQLTAYGLSAREISETTGMALNSIKNHKTNAYSRLGVRMPFCGEGGKSGWEAMRRAVRLGLVEYP